MIYHCKSMGNIPNCVEYYSILNATLLIFYNFFKRVGENMNQSDLRVIRSKKLIKESFINLMEEIGYENITIKAIAKRAMINRKTFYNHYDSIDALFTNILQSMIGGLLDGLLNDDPRIYLNPSEELNKKIKIFLHNLSDNKKLIYILFNDASGHDLIYQLGEQFMQRIFEKVEMLKLLKKDSCVPADLLSIKITTLFMAVMRWYVENNDNYSEEDTAKIVMELIT